MIYKVIVRNTCRGYLTQEQRNSLGQDLVERHGFKWSGRQYSKTGYRNIRLVPVGDDKPLSDHYLEKS